MTFSDLLTNVHAFAHQCASRVRTLRGGICLVGSAAEVWDDTHQHWRLPTADELVLKVRAGIGRPYPHRPAGYPWTPGRRELTTTEIRKLIRYTRHCARAVRRQHPHLT